MTIFQACIKRDFETEKIFLLKRGTGIKGRETMPCIERVWMYEGGVGLGNESGGGILEFLLSGEGNR